jgi:hypothetical protein
MDKKTGGTDECEQNPPAKIGKADANGRRLASQIARMERLFDLLSSFQSETAANALRPFLHVS